MDLLLYDYWRSSAGYRVRIALNLKGVAFDRAAVNLHPKVKAQLEAGYAKVNPQMRVPALSIDGRVMNQSMAILEWIEETMDGHRLLPDDPFERMRVRAMADLVACDIHPLNNVSVLGWLRSDLGASEEAVQNWYAEWITRGFTALEAMAGERGDDFLGGTAPGLADCTLVPQMSNARRYEVPLGDFPSLIAIDERCRAIDAFAKAAPEVQSDAPDR